MSEENVNPSELFLRDKATGADKERECLAVDRLLSLGHHAGKQEPKYSDALTREIMKGLDNGR